MSNLCWQWSVFMNDYYVTKWTTHLGGIVACKKSNGECG